MAFRTITTGRVHGGIYNGEAVACTVTADTGPVKAPAKIIAATMELNSILTTRDDVRLMVHYNSESSSAVAITEELPKNSSGYINASVAFTNYTTGLLDGDLDSLYLRAISGNENMSLKDIAFSNAIITIDVEYVGYCLDPGTPHLSASQSMGESVVLQWSAGAGGEDNAFSYYEVVRGLSTDGGATWDNLEEIAQTTNTYLEVQPPETVGHMYRYIVRTVGAAGADYSSSYVLCAEDLLRYEVTKCGPPRDVTLSVSENSGTTVLFWTDGTPGVENFVSYYEVWRSLSTDGGATWGAFAELGTSTVYYMFVEPPETVGHMYRYIVRTVGTAGVQYASEFVESDKTLKKIKAEITAYTDPEIMPGITKVKAVHITELQTNINRVLEAGAFFPYKFTDIRAGYTSLAGWNAHIRELRTAIDGMNIQHETWLPLSSNAPRADVIMQLRRVVEAVAND